MRSFAESPDAISSVRESHVFKMQKLSHCSIKKLNSQWSEENYQVLRRSTALSARPNNMSLAILPVSFNQTSTGL
eukprot:3908268-Amphidinium_carterae.1